MLVGFPGKQTETEVNTQEVYQGVILGRDGNRGMQREKLGLYSMGDSGTEGLFKAVLN